MTVYFHFSAKHGRSRRVSVSRSPSPTQTSRRHVETSSRRSASRTKSHRNRRSSYSRSPSPRGSHTTSLAAGLAAELRKNAKAWRERDIRTKTVEASREIDSPVKSNSSVIKHDSDNSVQIIKTEPPPPGHNSELLREHRDLMESQESRESHDSRESRPKETFANLVVTVSNVPVQKPSPKREPKVEKQPRHSEWEEPPPNAVPDKRKHENTKPVRLPEPPVKDERHLHKAATLPQLPLPPIVDMDLEKSNSPFRFVLLF